MTTKTEDRCCKECGKPMGGARDHRAEFCATPCRKTWNNRRAVRGAELYDCFMALRYQRALGKALGLWQIMCRMGQMWRGEDATQRAARQSWADPTTLDRRLIRYRSTNVS